MPSVSLSRPWAIFFYTYVDPPQVVSQGLVEVSHSTVAQDPPDPPQSRLQGLQGPRAATNQRVGGPPAINLILHHLAI